MKPELAAWLEDKSIPVVSREAARTLVEIYDRIAQLPGRIGQQPGESRPASVEAYMDALLMVASAAAQQHRLRLEQLETDLQQRKRR